MSAVCGEGLVVSCAPFGERDVFVRLLCAERGLVRGLVKHRGGGAAQAVVQPFNAVRYQRFRRLEGQLGTVSLELVKSRAPVWFKADGSLTVAYLSELLAHCLPEEEGFPGLCEAVEGLLEGPCGWREVVRFELGLLERLGYGLRLGEVVTGEGEGGEVAFVSPSSGRSVTRAAAAGWEAKLLVLPHFLGGPSCTESEDMGRAWRLTGAFLHRALQGRKLEARGRLEAYWRGKYGERLTVNG